MPSHKNEYVVFHGKLICIWRQRKILEKEIKSIVRYGRNEVVIVYNYRYEIFSEMLKIR